MYHISRVGGAASAASPLDRAGAGTGPHPGTRSVRGGSMSRLSLFSSPLLLGFDQFERALDRVSKATADGYPPYNVEQVAENALRLTLAVAGFKPEELSVQIEDNQLVIRGKQSDEADRIYL